MNKTTSMRIRRFGITMAVLAFCVGQAGAQSDLPPLPSMACPVIAPNEAPKLDGKLDETGWSKGDVQNQWHRYYHGLTRPQDFRLLTDGEWLYIGMTAGETAVSEDNTETVEISVAPQKASDQFVHFVVVIGPAGITKRNPDDETRWKSAFRQFADRWVLEMAIKTAPVFIQPLAKGKVFDFNLSRTRSQTKGDKFDVYQQWSNTGTSSGARYRFGEVTVGNPADRIPLIESELQSEIDIADKQADSLSDKAKQTLSELKEQARTLLAASPDTGVITSAAAGVYQRQADVLKRSLRRTALADRKFVVWSCNPMATPLPIELPFADQKDATEIDVRVLGGEWESAALVVNNLTDETLDARVSLTEFVSADGRTVPGWDVLQVRTAPLIVVAGSSKRDPLPRLQDGGLFRAPADRNELLWLTFRSLGLEPGKYKSTLTITSLDGRLRREVALTLRVYPLALGAVGKPFVHVWNSLVRGKNMSEIAANCRDYYIQGFQTDNRKRLPRFQADADGNITNSKLDFKAVDGDIDHFLSSGLHTFLFTASSYSSPEKSYFWPAVLSDKTGSEGWPDTAFNFKRWSPKFNELFASWVTQFRDYLQGKGLPPERWAFYVMDEPPPGGPRQEVINFAKQVRKIDPRVRTYVTFPISAGSDDENVELAKHIDTVQVVGAAKPEVMAKVKGSVRNFWTYWILNRTSSAFHAYRKDVCWESLKNGYTGTGFWVWDDPNPGSDFTWQMEGNAFFQSLYSGHDGTIIPSLRTEAFREGIEDWKYVIMLDDVISAAEKKGVVAPVISSAKAYRAKCLDELTDANSAYRFRDTMRSHLLALHEAMGDIDKSAVQAIENK